MIVLFCVLFFFSSRRRHTRCALVTGVQTCALPIFTDLGLRCSEVVKLRLDDLDWRNGIIRIARTKTHFTDSLPLLAATGDAIADYLRHERPKTSNRAIFVRHVAPYDEIGRAHV